MKTCSAVHKRSSSFLGVVAVQCHWYKIQSNRGEFHFTTLSIEKTCKMVLFMDHFPIPEKGKLGRLVGRSWRSSDRWRWSSSPLKIVVQKSLFRDLKVCKHCSVGSRQKGVYSHWPDVSCWFIHKFRDNWARSLYWKHGTLVEYVGNAHWAYMPNKSGIIFFLRRHIPKLICRACTCLIIAHQFHQLLHQCYWLYLNSKFNLTCIHDFLVPIQPKALQLWQHIKGFEFLRLKFIINSCQSTDIQIAKQKRCRYL